jgi:hypothetical protein
MTSSALFLKIPLQSSSPVSKFSYSWENDDLGMISKESLASVFEKTFGYTGHNQIVHFEIPSSHPPNTVEEAPFPAVCNFMGEFQKDAGAETLLVVYYTGGGSLNEHGSLICHPRR